MCHHLPCCGLHTSAFHDRRKRQIKREIYTAYLVTDGVSRLDAPVDIKMSLFSFFFFMVICHCFQWLIAVYKLRCSMTWTNKERCSNYYTITRPSVCRDLLQWNGIQTTNVVPLAEHQWGAALKRSPCCIFIVVLENWSASGFIMTSRRV